MEIKFEKNDEVSGVLSIKLAEADYAPEVKKQLNKFCQNANVPGFRKGHVPASYAKKMYGTQAKAEAVNRQLSDALGKYIADEKLPVLGEPMTNEKQQPQDIENGTDFEFFFDLALAPTIKVNLTAKDKVPYYDIQVSDEQVQQQVEAFAQRNGHNEDAKKYSDRDIVRGVLGAVEGETTVDGASVMPAYFKNEDQKKLFKGAKVNDVVTFDPWVAYDGNETEIAALLKVKKEEVAALKGEYRLQIETISHYVAAKVDQELFDAIYGKDACKSEEEFRQKIKEGMQQQYVGDSDYKFLLDLRAHLEKKAGKVVFPEAILKRFMMEQNKDKEGFTEEKLNEEFPESIKQLQWHLMREQLVEKMGIKVDDADVKAAAVQAARFQFAQYGINNIPDEYLENYAKEMMQKREQVNQLVEHVINQKLTQAAKNLVALDRKEVTVEEFEKLVK